MEKNMNKQTKPYKTVIFDMDGVLAEVSKSYRAAIVATCHKYGATYVTDDVVTQRKALGNANDDWKLSYELIQNSDTTVTLLTEDMKKDITLEKVTETFEEFYQGTIDKSGLYKLETLIPKHETLQELKRKSLLGIGIVTGRPRNDCIKFLKDHNIRQYFTNPAAIYCMEDGPSKPNPVGIRVVYKALCNGDDSQEPDDTVVFIGDTPDDIMAAMNAGCCGVGVITPEAAVSQTKKNEPYHLATLPQAMLKAGANIILKPGFEELIDMFEEPSTSQE